MPAPKRPPGTERVRLEPRCCRSTGCSPRLTTPTIPILYRDADPFVIAKAAVAERTVVTMEQRQPNAVKIPNICEHFGIPCMTLEDFMETEDWEF